jgi:nickel-dependent lactate racemase
MQISVNYGAQHIDLDVNPGNRIDVRREPPAPALTDPMRALAEALERPLGFPALRQALTPDDHVAVVVDEHLPPLPGLLTPIIEHIQSARVSTDTITVICPSSVAQGSSETLPAALQGIHVDVHDPTDRRRLSYLATTRQGRRVYLNRTAVDADQLVVLSRRRFDPLLGYAGAEGALYPALSDEATRQEMCGRLSLAVPGKKSWPTRRQAEEVTWLLGAPFMIQLVEGAGHTLTHVLTGLADTGEEAVRLLNARWRLTVESLADVVIATLTGPGEQQTFADLAEAAACAARVVKADGRIIILSEADPQLGAGAALVREAADPEQALKGLRRNTPTDMIASFQWASAAQRARIYLHSRLPDETAEELFAVPLDRAGQVQRLLSPGERFLILEDAHKTLAVAKGTSGD